MYYPQRFGDRYVHGDDPLPYFVPLTTASSIWTYSVVCVPSHLCLALVIQPQSNQQGATLPTCLYCKRSKKTGEGQAFPHKS